MLKSIAQDGAFAQRKTVIATTVCMSLKDKWDIDITSCWISGVLAITAADITHIQILQIQMHLFKFQHSVNITKCHTTIISVTMQLL